MRADHDDVIAEVDDRPVGVVSVGPHGDAGVAWVSKVFVLAEARGRGIGRALLRAAHEAARARGYSRVGLRTRLVFREALELYECEGYKRYVVVSGTETESGDVVLFRPL